MTVGPLFRQQELAFRTQYAELKERVFAQGLLLPGTPGTLKLRRGTGFPYWYRVFYPVPDKQSEELVGREDDSAALEAMQSRMDASAWVAQQVSNLRKLQFQVADKLTARVLVELYNRGAFGAGLVLVGTLGYMAWLNELGAIAVSARTMDIDLARHQRLKLGATLPLLDTLKSTGMPFVAVPGLPADAPSTSLKLPGVQGLRVDLLAPGKTLGAAIRIPELDWAAQAVPHFDYLLDAPETGAMLAGGHCIPVRLPQAARQVWHKLYASTNRRGFADKAEKDRQQALTLAAALMPGDAEALPAAFATAPTAIQRAVRPLRATLCARTEAHPQLRSMLAECLER